MTNILVGAIHRLDLDTGSNFIIPLSGVQRPVAVDYDYVDDRLYWTDGEDKTIRSAFLNGSDVRLLRNLGPSKDVSMNALCLLPLSRCLMHVIFVTNDKRTVQMLTLHARCPCYAPGAVPDGLAVDQKSRLLVYTDAGNKLIGMLTMSGNKYKTIVNTGLNNPRDVELDKRNG